MVKSDGMNENLKKTLKAFPVVAVATIAICPATEWIAKTFFGVTLGDQASIDAVRMTVTWLVKKLCAGAGWNWIFFGDLWSLAKITGVILVVAPVLEETVFRWLLWKLPRPANKLIPAATSSALFSAAHYIFAPWPDNAFVALFFFGLAQCWIYEKTGRLWCAMLNHALFNAANFALIFVFAP